MSDEGPFEELDEAVEGREGDPFDDLGYPDDGQAAEETDTEAESERPDGDDPAVGSPDDDPLDWTEAVESPERTGDSDETETTDTAADQTAADTSDMNFGIGRREHEGTPEAPSLDTDTREGDPFENVRGAFEEMAVSELDPDSVWQQLASAESRGSVGDARERTYADVSKHSYCEQCEHFSEPPNIFCSHEGTEIVEFLDMDTVRVVDCPIVAEREELENS